MYMGLAAMSGGMGEGAMGDVAGMADMGGVYMRVNFRLFLNVESFTPLS
jgi:hypothetical protein